MVGVFVLVIQTIMLTLIAPLAEEIFWRGYIQSLLHKIFKWRAAILIQAFLFALVHIGYFFPGKLNIFFLGLVLGIWRWRKKTMIPLIVTHMALNSFSCYFLWYNQLEIRKIKETVDYRAALENLCKSADYMPEKNAFVNYTRAFDLLNDKPANLSYIELDSWPGNLPNDKKLLLNNRPSR